MPIHYIHDITHAYGRLLVPVWWCRKYGVRWLMLTEQGRIKLSTAYHNCSRHGY